MILRKFKPADQNEARSLILSGLGEHFGFIDQTLNPDLDDIQTYYINQGHFFIVAEEKNRLVGTAGLVLENPSQSRIVRMSVLKDHRRKGIAQALLNHVIEISHQRKISQILVSTDHPWRDAIGFYRNAGFIPYDRDEIEVHMRRTLHYAQGEDATTK